MCSSPRRTSIDSPRSSSGLDRTDEQTLRETIIEAWLVRAPKKMADAYLADRAE
ncbi:MAG: hypothetical protein ACLP0J_17995 [Solirubrobacteraceae bacterium]